MGSEKEKVNGVPLHALQINVNDQISSVEHCHHFEFGASSESRTGELNLPLPGLSETLKKQNVLSLPRSVTTSLVEQENWSPYPVGVCKAGTVLSWATG